MRGFAAVPIATGDVNADGFVDIDDVLLLINGWGPSGETCFENLDANSPLDVDGLLNVLAHYQSSL